MSLEFGIGVRVSCKYRLVCPFAVNSKARAFLLSHECHSVLEIQGLGDGIGVKLSRRLHSWWCRGALPSIPLSFSLDHTPPEPKDFDFS